MKQGYDLKPILWMIKLDWVVFLILSISAILIIPYTSLGQNTTPDKPGNFSGGMVDVGTKNYPKNFTLKFSTSSSYNTETSLESNYLNYSVVPGIGWAWMMALATCPEILEIPRKFRLTRKQRVILKRPPGLMKPVQPSIR